ncbi:hypothetical protein [Bartonella sp. B17]
MKLSKNVKLIIFFIMAICISSIIIVSISEAFYNPSCQTSEYGFAQDKIKSGQNSFTALQIKNYLTKNGFSNIKRLRLDDKGIWRALVEFKKCHFLISIDYSGAICIQNERDKYD